MCKNEDKHSYFTLAFDDRKFSAHKGPNYQKHNFAGKEKLYTELGWETITECGNLLSLNIFHKIPLHETRPLIKNCMPV